MLTRPGHSYRVQIFLWSSQKKLM